MKCEFTELNGVDSKENVSITGIAFFPDKNLVDHFYTGDGKKVGKAIYTKTTRCVSRAIDSKSVTTRKKLDKIRLKMNRSARLRNFFCEPRRVFSKTPRVGLKTLIE